MEQNQPFFGGIPGPRIDLTQLQEALQNMLHQAAGAGTPALLMFARLQESRAARLNDAAKTISEMFGKDHPDVAILTNIASSVERLRTQMISQATRMQRWPKPRPKEWLVFGTVIDAQGKPGSGLTVRVFDRDRKYDDLLGETTTDEFGDFSVIYHERDFAEAGEKLPDLYVMVSDSGGKVIYSTRDKIRFEAGKSEYFAIRLDQKTEAKKSGTQTTKISRKKR
jgi:hypothetical protein